MTDFPVTRRDLLQVTGAGVVGIAGLSRSGAAEDSSGGEKIWEFETGDEVFSSPTVVDGTVFIGSNDSNVYALDAGDGTKLWHFDTEDIVRASSPTVVDGTVFVGSYDENVYALDAGDGTEQWRFETSGRVSSSPTVVDGTVFVGSNDEKVYALDVSDGTEQWHFDTGDRVWTSPTVADDTVFVGSNDEKVYALDVRDGTEQWHFDTGDRATTSPTVVDNTVFIGSQLYLYALDATNGAQRWRFRPDGSVYGMPTVVDGSVFIGDAKGHIYALDADNGVQQWSFETDGWVWSSPTVADDTVFVGSWDSNVYALNADNGTEQWRFQTGYLIESSPTVVDGTVFIGSRDSNVYALDAGVEGSSQDSRVNLGTLGHHHVFAENGPTGPGIPDDPQLGTSITGSITDSAGDPLEDIEIRAENRGTDDVTTTATNADGEYNIALEANTEYRIFIFDQFGLEQTEFEEIVELNEEETRELNIELLSKFEVFKEQKLGSDRIAGLAPRIDDLSTPLITEQNTVEAEIDGIESGVENGQIGQEFADELVERMVFGEAMVTRSLEALIDTTPTNLAGYDWSQGPLIYEDEMPDYDLLFQTSKAIVIGLVEASYSLKKIAKEALGEFGDQIRSRILTAIGNFIRDRLSDFQRVLDTAESAWSIREMLVEIKAAADEALVRIQEGPTDDNKRAVILELAEPIAEQIATSLLAGVELLTIEDQLAELNNILSSDSLGTNFANDITTIADNTRTALRDVETKVQQAEDAMEPESDALEGLLDLVSELADAGLTDVPALLNSIWDIVRSLVSVISSGFNIGFGIVRARDVYTDSATVVNDITDTV